MTVYYIYVCVYRLLYQNLMVTANKKSIYVYTQKEKESKPNTKDSHQITRGETKRGKEEKRPTNPKQLTKWQ